MRTHNDAHVATYLKLHGQSSTAHVLDAGGIHGKGQMLRLTVLLDGGQPFFNVFPGFLEGCLAVNAILRATGQGCGQEIRCGIGNGILGGLSVGGGIQLFQFLLQATEAQCVLDAGQEILNLELLFRGSVFIYMISMNIKLALGKSLHTSIA